MEEHIAQLLDLQELDRTMDRLRADIESIPAEIEIHRKEMENHRSRFSEQEESLLRVRDLQKKLAADRADSLARIADYKSRLLNLKTNAEYTAMLNQIAHTEKMVDQIDEAILKAMYDEDEIAGTVARAEKDRDRALKRSRAREELLSGKVEELRAELAGLEEKRLQLAAAVPPKFLRRYEKARANGHREAVTGLRQGACGSCHTKIPPQSAGEIKAGSTFSCPICGSYVVWTSDSSL